MINAIKAVFGEKNIFSNKPMKKIDKRMRTKKQHRQWTTRFTVLH